MKLALALAAKGAGKTSPNPMVGAVIVKNGRIVGKGYHRKAGLEHAEIAAIRDAGEKAKGATLYVTLEPCGRFGRTPPCAPAVIKAGIQEVIAAMRDPNPLNNGKGLMLLKKSGMKVTCGVLEKKAKQLNEVFIKYITTKMPFVTVKVAQSLDGKIATRARDSKWISSEESRAYVHLLRSRVDAVMVGAGTILQDDPLLTSRCVSGYRVQGAGFRAGKIKQPVKIIVDDALKIPLTAKIFGKDSPAKVIIATTKKGPKSRAAKFEKMGIEVLIIKEKNDKVDLRELMKELGKREITSVMVEGGGELIGSLVDERLADKFLIFVAPKIIGGRDAVTSVEGLGAKYVSAALQLKNIKYRRFSKDLLIEAYPL